MDERMKAALERTDMHLVRHLEDLNDEVDRENGRIKDHMIVDGMKDAVKTMHCIHEMMLAPIGMETGNGVSFQKAKAPSLM